MVSLRKFFLSAAALVAVAGVASAAATTVACTTASSTDVLRAEGKTELLSTLTYNCVPATPLASDVAFTFQLFTTGGVPVTSVDASSSTNTNKASISVDGASVVGTSFGYGTVSGNSITFPAVNFPKTVVSFTVAISGVRVDASQIATGGTIGLNILAASADSSLVTSNIFAGSPYSQISNAAVSLKSLNVTNVVGGTNYSVDSSAKYVKLTNCADIGSNFKLADGTNAVANTFTTVTFSGVLSTAFPVGQRLVFTVSNIPSGVTLYVPNDIAGSHASVSRVIGFDSTTLTGGYLWNATGSTDKYSAISSTGVVVYQVTSSDITVGSTVPVAIVAVTSNPVAPTTATAITAGYAPLGSTTIPRFIDQSAVASDIVHVSDCTSTLFFPYVVVGGGYDTGLAVANTGTDVTDPTTALDGTCTFTFNGASAPTTTYSLAVKAGQTNAFDLQTAYPDGNFSGYGVAVCTFQSGSGYAFVVNSQGSSASYLAK
jgi:hypothetical protein